MCRAVCGGGGGGGGGGGFGRCGGCSGFGLIVDVLSKISRFSTLFHSRVCVLCSLSGAIALDVPARVRV
jgi:hypothetical protein